MKSLFVVGATLFVSASVSMFAGNPQTAPRTGSIRAATSPIRTEVNTAAPDPGFLKQYCLGCHNDRARVGSLSLEAFDPAHLDGHIDVGEKVVRRLRTGMMPPENAPKPPAGARQRFATALEGQLDRLAALHPDPGAPALHRLNRAEYANAIRDLLALEVDVTALLPPDDSAAGFDNNADVLGVSPALIEGYASAAASLRQRRA